MVAFSRWSALQVPALESQPVRLEVAATDLSLRDGRLWLTNASQPFNGWMLERYADGSLRSRSEISNGLLHGWSEGWHTNGQLQVREPFFKGVSDGIRVKWYASGAKLSETGIVMGRLEGTFRRWYENGRLSEETEFREGKPRGLARAWYASGCLKSEVMVRDGITAEQRTWRDGEHPPVAASRLAQIHSPNDSETRTR
ncbi:MAG: toxin-antitoxin system YwqK family antitoxin [Verrucomicrobiales bacterium]|nr:toxin-antitoxin system YwqK family antitoxin [Verrucomicrobiales bacterium]